MLPALGIGALIGALGAKQRGGNMLKGALTGGILGAVTGGLGAKFGGAGAGTGLFGWGTGLKAGLIPAAMIGMGTEMGGQSEANKAALESRRQMFREEEEERLRRLSEIAGYDIADSENFLTPQSYFGRADGGIINTRQGYYNGGSATLDYTDPDLYTATGEGGGPSSNPIMQLPLGPEGSFTDEFEDLDYMEAGSEGDESGWYEMFFNEFGRPPVDINELQLFIDESDISPMDVAQGGGQEPMMAAEGGQVNRPGYFLGGIAALLGGAGILSKILGGRKSGEASPVTKPILKKLPRPGIPINEDDEYERRISPLLPVHQLFNRARGGSIERPEYDRGGNIHPGTEDEGFTYDIDIDGDKYDFSFAERFTDDPEKRRKIMEMIMMEARLKQPTGKLLQDTIDTTAINELTSGLGSGDEDRFNRRVELMEDRAMDYGKAIEDEPRLTKSQRGDIMEMIASRTNPMAFRAQGGRVHAKDGLWANIHAKRNRIKSGSGETMRSPGSAGAPTDEALRQSQATGGIADLDMRGGGASFGPGTGTSDDVPAMLSDGEFVMTANAVKNLGGGDRMVGAKRMYNMMNQLDPNSQSPGEMNVAGYG